MLSTVLKWSWVVVFLTYPPIVLTLKFYIINFLIISSNSAYLSHGDVKYNINNPI